jgi:hypothetical protein
MIFLIRAIEIRRYEGESYFFGQWLDLSFFGKGKNRDFDFFFLLVLFLVGAVDGSDVARPLSSGRIMA